jgi:hypothetical protein
MPLIAKIVGNGAADTCAQILPHTVARLFFGGALQKQDDKSGEYAHRYPVKDGFQSVFPLQFSRRAPYSSSAAWQALTNLEELAHGTEILGN